MPMKLHLAVLIVAVGLRAFHGNVAMVLVPLDARAHELGTGPKSMKADSVITP